MIIRLAEILLSAVFVLGGFAAFRDPEPRAQQLKRFRMPFPVLQVRLNAAVMMVAGAALALNIVPALASTVLAALLIPTTLVGHAFWVAEGPAREQQLAHFAKNVAILGGLVAMVVATG